MRDKLIIFKVKFHNRDFTIILQIYNQEKFSYLVLTIYTVPVKISLLCGATLNFEDNKDYKGDKGKRKEGARRIIDGRR